MLTAVPSFRDRPEMLSVFCLNNSYMLFFLLFFLRDHLTRKRVSLDNARAFTFHQPRRSSTIRFNFVDSRRSTSRVTEIEISPSAMLVVSPICGAARAESPRKEDIFKCMQALCARGEFRDANIYTRVNLQSYGVNYAFSQSPLELNTGSEVAQVSIPRRLARDNYPRWLFKKCERPVRNAILHARIFTRDCRLFGQFIHSPRDLIIANM